MLFKESLKGLGFGVMRVSEGLGKPSFRRVRCGFRFCCVWGQGLAPSFRVFAFCCGVLGFVVWAVGLRACTHSGGTSKRHAIWSSCGSLGWEYGMQVPHAVECSV